MQRILILSRVIGIVVALCLCGCGHSTPHPPIVRFSPGVWGEEPTTRDGKDYRVRWLQQRSEFTVQNDGSSRKVKVGFSVGTFRVERNVWLEQQGRPLPVRQTVQKAFWEGGDVLVENTATLTPGENTFAILTDGAPVELSPGRSAFLLLVGGIEISEP